MLRVEAQEHVPESLEARAFTLGPFSFAFPFSPCSCFRISVEGVQEEVHQDTIVKLKAFEMLDSQDQSVHQGWRLTLSRSLVTNQDTLARPEGTSSVAAIKVKLVEIRAPIRRAASGHSPAHSLGFRV